MVIKGQCTTKGANVKSDVPNEFQNVARIKDDPVNIAQYKDKLISTPSSQSRPILGDSGKCTAYDG